MISLIINGQSYQIVSEWADVTLSKAAELYALKMPESLRHVYDVTLRSTGLTTDEIEEKITEAEKLISIEDQHKHIPRYFSLVVMTLSDIPTEVIRQTDVISMKSLYHTFLKKFVEGVHFIPSDYAHKEIGEFEHEGVVYKLPVNKTIFGQSVPMADISALEFTESADLMIYLTKLQQERDLSRIANLIAILCRPEGEEYVEEVSLERAERFKNLPMDVCWNVFFSLITPLVIFAQYEQIYFLQKEMEKGVMN